MKRIFEWVVFILTGQGPIKDLAVRAGLVDYSGQGRDEYGK
jgi:hypothetical protein